jgi:hypothetical protein
MLNMTFAMFSYRILITNGRPYVQPPNTLLKIKIRPGLPLFKGLQIAFVPMFSNTNSSRFMYYKRV